MEGEVGMLRESEAAGVPASPVLRRLRAPGLLELEELLGEYLHTRVGVSMGSSKGKISIEFADLEDLERIYRIMTEPSTLTRG